MKVFLKVFEIVAILIGTIVMLPALIYLAIDMTWLFVVIMIFCWPVLMIAQKIKIFKLEKEIKALKKEA